MRRSRRVVRSTKAFSAREPQYADVLQEMRLKGNCTGCRKALPACNCGRAAMNRCTGCGRKLWNGEGVMKPFMVQLKEFCSTCVPKESRQWMQPNIPNKAGLDITRYWPKRLPADAQEREGNAVIKRDSTPIFD